MHCRPDVRLDYIPVFADSHPQGRCTEGFRTGLGGGKQSSACEPELGWRGPSSWLLDVTSSPVRAEGSVATTLGAEQGRRAHGTPAWGLLPAPCARCLRESRALPASCPCVQDGNPAPLSQKEEVSEALRPGLTVTGSRA